VNACLRFAAILVLLVQPVFAAIPGYDEHLLPEDSVFEAVRRQEEAPQDAWDWAYEMEVVRRFSEMSSPDIIGRMLVLPLNGREHAIALGYEKNQYRILSLELSEHLLEFEERDRARARLEATSDESEKEELAAWIQHFERHLPPSRDDLVVDRCERKIPVELGAKLHALWGEMLFRTRYRDDRPVKPDEKGSLSIIFGNITEYHFAFDYQMVRLEGQVVNPGKDSHTGKFIAIVNLLRDACAAPRRKGILADIERRTDELTASLSETVY